MLSYIFPVVVLTPVTRHMQKKYVSIQEKDYHPDCLICMLAKRGENWSAETWGVTVYSGDGGGL